MSFTVHNVLRTVERGLSSNVALALAGGARCRRGLPTLGNGVLTCGGLTGFDGRVQKASPSRHQPPWP